MNNLSLLYLRFRHLYVPASLLLMLLQRTPIIRAIISTESAGRGPMSAILRSAIAGSAALGAVQTVAGATALTPAPGSNNNPAQTKVGEAFTGGFAIVGAESSPGSYEVKGTLPPGLTVNGMSGNTVNGGVVTITGTPTEAGSFPLSIRAWHGANKSGDGGEGTYSYTINVEPGVITIAPTFSTQPTSFTGPPGSSITLISAASGEPTPTLQWHHNGAAISGANTSQLALNNIGVSQAGDYTVTATNSAGNITSSIATVTVKSPTATLDIDQHPAAVSVLTGSDTVLSVSTSAQGATGIQWYRYSTGGGTASAIPGATNSDLTLTNLQAQDMGFYYAEFTRGTETISSGIVTVAVTGQTSRLLNLSTRGRILTGGNLTPGFVMRGDGQKLLLMRSVGPQLRSFGVEEALNDPVMNVIPLSGSTPEKHNDNWGENPSLDTIRNTMQSVGAFALDDGSLDAALLEDLALPNSMGNRGYTIQIGATSSSDEGIAIAEIYDPEVITSQTALINVSARGFSGAGADALVPGFVIGGNGPKRMLIRVVGPTLADFGVQSTMPNPRLSVIPLGHNFTVAANDNWNGEAELSNAFAEAGAFNFSAASSLDAAVVVTLPPGGYTVRVESTDGTYGEVLVEAYDLD